MPEIADPPVTISNLPAKSFFDSPEFQNPLAEALEAAEKARSNAPAEKAIAAVPEVKPVTQPEPAPAKNDKPAEPATPAKDEMPADIKSESSKKHWKKLEESKRLVESERDTLKKERDDFRVEIDRLKKMAVTPAEKKALADEPEFQQVKKSLADKEKELEEYSERIRLIDVEKHPKFIKYFSELVESQLSIAKTIGGDKAMAVLKLPAGPYRDEQLAALAEELPMWKAAQLATVATQLDAIDGQRASEISKARDSYAQMQVKQKKESEQQQQAISQTIQKIRNEVVGKDTGLPVFQEREGDAEYNKGVQERLALVDMALSGQMKPEDIVRSAYWAAAAPQLLIELNGERSRSASRIQELEAEITKLRAVEPNPGGAKPGENDPAPAEPQNWDGYLKKIEAAMPGRA